MATVHDVTAFPARHLDDVAVVEGVLTDPALAHLVELVVRRDRDGDPDSYEAAAVDGRVRFRRRSAPGNAWAFAVTAVEGRNPLGDQSVDRFVPLAAEQAQPFPDRTANAYPHAYEQVAQLFDSPAAPDLVVLHTAAHHWADQGGHLGEHGSMGVIQARAPFIVSGAGARADGLLDRSCRLVDIAPTVLALAGAAPVPAGSGVGLDGTPLDGALLARQDGMVQDAVLDLEGPRPDHIVGFLLDGANANVLHDLIASGDAPNIARLLEHGTGLRFGAMSSLPTVTLANHTAILTGCHPGHHGVLHNAWYDRARGEQVITNSPMHWVSSMQHLQPAIETIHQAIKRSFPESVTVSINEPCDVGADHSVFDQLRRGEDVDRPPPLDDLPHATERFVRPVKEYRWSSLVDHLAVEQFAAIWGGSYRGQAWALPRFTWVNLSLTDAAFHEGGPYSEIARAAVHDTDARVGEMLAAVERAGVFDRTAFFLTADHGMEQSDPGCTGDWGHALEATGIPYRDEGYGFIYVNP